MIIIYCSKPQQTDAVTPTPLAHRSHTCMLARALGHDMITPSGMTVQSILLAFVRIQRSTYGQRS